MRYKYMAIYVHQNLVTLSRYEHISSLIFCGRFFFSFFFTLSELSFLYKLDYATDSDPSSIEIAL